VTGDVMEATVDAQGPSRSSRTGGPVPIGEAARLVGLAPSAIRYYESEQLIAPPTRRDGRRRYGGDELRRLAFIAFARDLGLGLSAIRRALRPGPAGWAGVVDEQIAALDAQIARAQRAREVLAASRDCPAAEPVRDCPHLTAALDAALDGALDGAPAEGLSSR
jgi:MerR family transcriptional regulator, redox-sensitive transcriptional activator SoxR